jgi:hypothetical protein
MKLAQTLRSWASKYGSEAALVGRVAVAAFIPPGANVLIEKGLEAAFEYIQSHPDKAVNETVLSQQVQAAGLDSNQTQHLSQLVQQIDHAGSNTLDQAFSQHKAGLSRDQVEQHLRQVIATDPTLSALRNSLEKVSSSLLKLTEQGEVLIAGQAYQAAALEEMMQMIRGMAQQMNLGSAIPTASNQLLEASHLVSSSSHHSASLLDATNLTSGRDHHSSSFNALDQLNQNPLVQSSSSSGAKALRANTKTSMSATDLVARFKQLSQGKNTLLDGFARAEQRSSDVHTFDCPQVGQGRVALSMLEVGHQPLLIVKWLCETWSYSLPDALIATQNTPVIIQRSDQFVQLGQAQQALSQLGAKLQLKT